MNKNNEISINKKLKTIILQLDDYEYTNLDDFFKNNIMKMPYINNITTSVANLNYNTTKFNTYFRTRMINSIDMHDILHEIFLPW